MELKETPERIVENGEIVEYGAFKTPFKEFNLSDARISVGGRKMPRFYSRFRLKEWQHIGMIGEDFYFGFAIVNAKYLGNSFCYLLDRTTGAMVEHDRLAPPGIAKVAPDLWHDECGFRFMGYEIKIENRLADGFHRAQVRIKESSKRPGISAEVEVIEDLEKVQPLILVSPLKGNRPGYTHKVACPVRGEIVMGGKTYTLKEETGIALIDVQRTFFPYKIFWDWATCGGYDKEGRMIALNLSQGSNLRTEEINDNCIWVDGKISFLGQSSFQLDEKAVLEPWHIETTNQRCVLDFKPEGERWGKINVFFIMSDFHQPYGTFRGKAVDSDGNAHEISDYFGVVEHHLAKF